MVSVNGNKILGIDLGTTFSAIGHIDEHGKAEILLNKDNLPLTPSAVLFEGNDNIVVGQLARDSAVAMPENVVTLVKRHMGRDTRFTPGGQEFTPEEISAMILRKLKQDAEERLGEEIREAVITIPAWFGTGERKATQDAGEMAGLTVRHILNEPTAAALAFGFAHAEKEETILVYDLGGGTFDITLLKIRPPAKGNIPEVEMISTGGNHDLGGANWDEELMKYVADAFVKKYGVDPRRDCSTEQDLYIRCESAKKALAKLSKTRITCQHEGKTLVVDLDREKLKELTSVLLTMTESELDLLLEDKGYKEEQIDQVLLVGGSTRLLMVREMLEKKFPGKLNTSVDPDQCVAQGAAWMGHLISRHLISENGNGEALRACVVDVSSHALGVGAIARDNGKLRVFPVIVKDTRLPCHETRCDLRTLYDNQRSVLLEVFENEARSRDELLEPEVSRKIGEVSLDGLPGGRPSGQPLEVTYRFDASFRLYVTARDVNSGAVVEGELKVSGLDGHKKKDTEEMLSVAVIEG